MMDVRSTCRVAGVESRWMHTKYDQEIRRGEITYGKLGLNLAGPVRIPVVGLLILVKYFAL